MKLKAYFALMRLDKPVGILLLWFPTAWALWIANQGHPALKLIFIFLLGTIIMRSAGCVLNDIADRNIDRHVKRTSQRPLTSGKVNLTEAFILLIGLLFLALILLFQLPTRCIGYAFAALAVTAIYPFCKRFFKAPQMILGIAFSMSIPMGYAASFVQPDATMFLLIAINFLWIIAYDTMYAMADRVEDLRIGIQSTAILFAQYDRLIIGMIQFIFHSLWFILAWNLGYSSVFYLAWVVSGGLLLYQQKLVNTRNEAACFQAFMLNSLYGLLIWAGILGRVIN